MSQQPDINDFAQHLHDYLIKTEILTEEELEVYAEEGRVKSKPAYDARNGTTSKAIVYRDHYQINILIKNFPSTRRDFRKIKIALIWWLDLYQPDTCKDDDERFGWLADNLGSKTTDIWIGIPIEEKVIMRNGVIKTCMEKVLIENPDLKGMPVFLQDASDTNEEILLGTTDG